VGVARSGSGVTLTGRTVGLGVGVTAASAAYTFQVFMAVAPTAAKAVSSSAQSSANR
jgi:hypothetical protein